MGWTCTNHWNASSKDFILNRFTETSRDGTTSWEFIDHAMVGSTFYGICKRTNLTNNVAKYFGVIILTSRHKNGEICWKDMDEGMGPYEAKAPLRIINKLDELAPNPDRYAQEWRDRCRSHAQARKKRQVSTGTVVRYNGTDYRLERPAGPRKGWYVTNPQTGQQYRMKAYQLSQSEIIKG